MPARVQLKRTKGWRMPEGAVKVDRSTIWGNPWSIEECGSAEKAVRSYRARLEGEPIPHPESRMGIIRNGLPSLRGKDLACWCRPGEPCHADVLLELANA